jgi:chromosome segregation ATPase
VKVLKKDEIQAQIARDQKQKIDDSVAIEQKADQARRDFASLQTQHQTFIAGMKGSMERELEPLRREKADLIFTIGHARTELAQLRQPLDAEWKDVTEKKAEVELFLKELNQRESDLVKGEREIEREKSIIEADRKEVIALKEEAVADMNISDDMKAEAGRILSNAKTESEKRMAEADERERQVVQWEIEATTKEIGLNDRYQELNVRERVLNERERFINDKYATFERTVNRLKK